VFLALAQNNNVTQTLLLCNVDHDKKNGFLKRYSIIQFPAGFYVVINAFCELGDERGCFSHSRNSQYLPKLYNFAVCLIMINKMDFHKDFGIIQFLKVSMLSSGIL
jgi:hypothetical protein